MDKYGRYIDPVDGMPRWNLPPKEGLTNTGERSRLINEAIRELFPDYGTIYVRERLGTWISRSIIHHRARAMGICLTPKGWKSRNKRNGDRLRRLYKAERARLAGGLPQLTRLKVEREMSKSGWKWRSKLHFYYGYVYGEPPFEMLYDANTRRRIPPFKRPTARNSEEILHERFGFVFRPVSDIEEERVP